MKNVLITGGSGTLGNALTQHLKDDCQITIYSRDPMKQIEMSRRFPDVRFVLGDVRDFSALKMVMAGHDTVIHAAAQKHIPQGEIDVSETISINVMGSQNVCQAAIEAGVKNVIGISTDKVCEPINTYGYTKALMERIFREYAALELTSFHLCRYGNVLGSTGSVVKVWTQMLDRDGYITATDPDMSRFWMTQKQAVQTVLLGLNQPSGTTLIPLLAGLDMRSFADYTMPDAEFRYMGLRPGEKRHETLMTRFESRYAEQLPGKPWNYPFSFLLLYPEPVDRPTSMESYSSDAPQHTIEKAELLEMLGL